ncbi:MAG TPA: CPBP family intramembrane glutamic endopeptidase [Terriglobia bacterium]|nr:CPBP family intramembrane glutamic endopeptidase [Terriglobia bacterium]
MTPAEINQTSPPLETPPPSQPAGGTAPPPPASSLWNWADLLLFLIFTALSFLTSYLVVSLGYLGVLSLGGTRGMPHAGPENSFLSLALQFCFYGLLFGFIYLLVVAYHRRPFWSSIQWRKPNRRQTLGYMAGGFLLAIFVQLAPTVLPDKQDFPLQQLFSSPLAAYAVGAFAIFIAPFMEELIFRGVLFAIFERQVNLVFAITVTALLFAALHIPEYRGAWNHLLLILFVGVVFSVARGLTRSLAPSVILHFAYNLSLIGGLYFQTQHFRTLGLI